LARRGAGGFVRTRLLRLGVPLLVFVLVVQPFTDYIGNLRDERGSFLLYLRGTEAGPMWFVAALLTFSVGYALVRGLLPAPDVESPPRAGVLAFAVLTVAVASFVVWQVSPLTGEAPLNLRFAEWPQGAVLFALGVWAAEAGWVDHPPSLHEVRWLGWAALAGTVAFVALLAVGVAAGEEDLGPGTGWPMVAAASLDGWVAVTWTVWFVVWFRGRWPGHGGLVGEAARASYATYVVHPLVITAAMLAFAFVDLGAWPKFVLVSVVAVPLCFAAGHALTRLPGVSRVL